MVKKTKRSCLRIWFVNKEMPNTRPQSQSYGTLLWFVQGHLIYSDQNKFFIQGSVKRANVNDQLQGLCCHKHHCNNSNALHNINIIITILLTVQRITRYSLAGRWLRSWGSQRVNLGGRTTALLGRPPGTIIMERYWGFHKNRICITTTINALALNPQTANGLSSQLCN